MPRENLFVRGPGFERPAGQRQVGSPEASRRKACRRLLEAAVNHQVNAGRGINVGAVPDQRIVSARSDQSVGERRAGDRLAGGRPRDPDPGRNLRHGARDKIGVGQVGQRSVGRYEAHPLDPVIGVV